jgi:N-ethylmaleimide reductase
MTIFSGVKLGELALANRIVMAPMTRSRSAADAVPTAMMVDYYSQRASAGLIVSEGIAPSADGLGYCRTPGLYNDAQVAAWSRVTAGVHAAGGRIVAQLMHVGRVASHFNKPAGSQTIAPSAIRARGEIYTDQAGMAPFDVPRALATDEIAGVVEDYRLATANAIAAGFDGVELHCTSGYLPAQFLSTGSNRRDDRYGGSVANRCRFALEVLAAMASVVGPGRVGMRICPDNSFNDLSDDNPQETFEHLLGVAAALELAYLHVIRMPAGRVDNIALGQRYFGDRLIVNESYGFEEASRVVASGAAAAVSFGRLFIANPDLVARFRAGAPLAKFDPRTLYAGGESGYSDYPAL